LEVPSIFLSHSSKDKVFTHRLASALRSRGVEVWLDELDISIGDLFLNKISEGINKTDYLGVVLSPHSVHSEWVNREVEVALRDEISSGQCRVLTILYMDCDIPPLLKGKHHSDFRLTDTNTVMFEEQVTRLAQTIQARQGAQNLERGGQREMFETIYLLLLLDQFQNGIWGASLEAAADYYGHSNDPGSISVSTFSCLAITRFTGSRTATAIQDYRNYLQRRQSSRGAFGMKRESGTKKYPKSEILEHARHTATALSFFAFYDGYGHSSVTRALDYLINERTPEGLWVDFGPLYDDNVDPITVAFVINAFEQVRRSILDEASGAEENSQIIAQIDSCITRGLDYIFTSPLRSREGFWHYKYSSDEEKKRVLRNLYQYTTDVLSAVALSCRRLGSYLPEIDMILGRLFSISSKHGGGLPRSPETHVPDLDATGRLISIAGNFPQWINSAHRLRESLPVLCSDSQVLMSGGANGWSSILLIYEAEASLSNKGSDERIMYINGLAQKIKEGNPDSVELPPEIVRYSGMVREILRRRKGVQPR
jgi:hypothetical protein